MKSMPSTYEEAIEALKRCRFYDEASREIDRVLVKEMPATLSTGDVRLMMIAAWLRGMTWERDQWRLGRHSPDGSSS